MGKKINYYRLKPMPPTPKDELCKCKKIGPIKIMSTSVFNNPLHCVYCNKEIRPERLNLNNDIIDAIAFWNTTYKAIDALWLASEEYEKWAGKELTNPKSAVNKNGIALAKEVSRALSLTCYYNIFQDSSTENYTPYTSCPICQGSVKSLKSKIKQSLCKKCNIVFFAE